MILLVAFWQIASSMPLQAATLYWDPDGNPTGNNTSGTGLGGTGTWDTSTANWWNLTSDVAWPNTNVDRAIFGASEASLFTPKTVTLVSGIMANQLKFERNGYTLTAGTLTLAGTTPGVYVNMGETATISSVIQGTDGFTKTGRGTLRLTNANTYTGVTNISNGTLVINNLAALGTDTSTVVVSGSATRGFGGGQLMLEGSYGTGINFTRGLSLQGQGPISDRGAALVTMGNHQISGPLTNTIGNVSTRIISVNGLLTFVNGLDAPGTAGTTLTTLGGTNGGGSGSYLLNGPLTGAGTLEKAGGGTLFLEASSTSGFSGTLRISASSVTQSSVRIESAGLLGTRTSTGTNAVLDMNGGVLEVRMDAPSMLAGGTAASVYGRAASTVFVDHSIGGYAVNGLATFNTFVYEDNITTTLNSRNGYGMTFATGTVNGGDNNSGIANGLAGLLTINGNFWNNSDNGANRTMTISGNGNTLINGNLLAQAASFNHNLTKSGTGLLTITSTGSTLDGTVNIQGGTLAITDFRSITNNTATVNIGTTTTGASLIIGTSVAANAADLTTNKVINLAGTTGSATIYANQAGSDAVTLNAVVNSGAGAKTLSLGGTNTANNTITSVLANNTANLSISKNGSGTWVLTGVNTYTGATTITNGTLKIVDKFTGPSTDEDVLASGSAITFNALGATGEAGGTFEYVGAAGVASTETVGALTVTAGAGTVKVTAGAGGSAALSFSNLARTAGATVNYAPGAGGTISFVAGGTVTNGILAAASGGAAYQTYNGLDWATIISGNVAQYTAYTVDAFPVSGVGGAGINYSQSISAATTGTASINTLKLIGGAGNPTITLGGVLTLTAKGVLFDNSAGGATITGSQLGAASVETVIITNGTTAANALTVNSLIGSGTGSLTKSGTGTLIIGGANTYTGNTNINEGTVILSGATASLGVISTAGNVTTLRQGATLDINGAGVANTVGIGALNGAGTITNSGAGTATAGTLAIGTAATTGNGVFSGLLKNGAGVLHVRKDGTGTQTLLGANTYSGVTTIGGSGSIIVNVLANLGQASGIGTGNMSDNAGSLIFTGSTAGLTYTGALMNGALTVGATSASTDRLFTLAGTGATLTSNAANNNSVVFTNTGDIVHGVVGPQSLILRGSSTGDNRLNLRITDSGTGANITSVTKMDAGKWVLGNTNTYTGATRVENGTLELAAANSISSDSALILGSIAGNGILEMSGNFTRTLSTMGGAGPGTVTWNSNLTTGGGGFAASGSKLVVAIGGIGTETALKWNTGGFVNTGATLVLGSTTALSEVEFRNAIDLDGAIRTILVNDNVNTGADFATITGAISNSSVVLSGLTKTGGGILQLFGNNTYTGGTAVQGGVLTVLSLGNSSVIGGSSSVGLTTDANTQNGAIALGNGGTGGVILQYVGTGEVSDRMIRLNTTTGTNQIHADGTGALVLTNVLNDMTGGAKVLSLRGSNTAGNMITSQLSDNGGTLGITVDGSATWILSNAANNYTGATAVNAGALGIGADTALGTGSLTLSNSTVFAYGADRTVANAVSQGNNTTQAFSGDYNLNFTSTYVLGVSANNIAINNTIASDKTLILGNITANALTGNRNFTIGGTGNTRITGSITTSTSNNLNIILNGTGTVTLEGTSSDWNTGSLTVSNGTLKLGASEVIPDSSPTDSGNVVFNPGAGVTATFDLNGKVETINGFSANSAGNIVIDNTSSTGALLTFGANNQAVDIGSSGTGTYTVTDSGSGALSIVKTGSGAGIIGPNVALTYQGTTSVTGGSLTINATLNGSTGLSVTNSGSVLTLNAGITTPSVVSSVTVGSGSTLSLWDGGGSKLNQLTSLSLGDAAGTLTTLNLNVGDGGTAGDNANTDLLALLTGGSLSLFAGNQILLNLKDAGLNENTTYTLLTSAVGGFTTGALTDADWLLGATPGGFTGITLNRTDTTISITTGALLVSALYWNGNGGVDTWNDLANWSSIKAGTTPAITYPGAGTDVVFIANNITGGAAITTTLEQNFKINSLNFEASAVPANTPVSVTINPGASTANRLEIAPSDPNFGITMAAGASPTVTIAAPLRLGANQRWNIVDAAAVLTISGALQGTADVTKDGLGRVILSAAADAQFNVGLTSDFTINGGTLELRNAGALGTVANNNLANVILNTGTAFLYNNATAGTVANNLTLSGATLSAGGTGHTYSGAVNVSADSVINMRDLNSGTLTTAARNITLSGALTGTGKLTVDSTTASPSGGNQIAGTLTLSNNNSGWSGGFDLLRGTITAAHANALGTGNINVSLGRIIFNAAGGTTFNLSQNITLDAPGGILEIQADASGTPVSDMVVNLNGTLKLGGTNANMALRLLPQTDNFSVLNINGPVILGGNASISTAGSTTRAATISGIISELGGSFGLTINDDLGGWGQTNQTLRLTGANTFTGGVNVNSGTLAFTTVSNNGGPASSLGMASDNITLSGGTLSFVGDGVASSQTTNRAISVTASSGLAANGTNGATITYTGAITSTANTSLTLSGTGAGFITGGYTQPLGAGSADLSVTGGTWTLSGTPFVLADDIIVSGATTVLNLNSTGIWSTASAGGTTSNLFIRGNSTVNLNANDVNGASNANGADVILVGDGTNSGIATLNTNTFNITIPRLDVGAIATGFEGNVIGTGTITGNGTATDWSTGFRLFRGTISANLAGGTTFLKQGLGDVTISGNNSGLTGTVTVSTRIDAGNLILDYTASNTMKIPTNRAVDMRGGKLTIVGNGSASTTANVNGLVLTSGGSSQIELVNNGFATTLNLGAISRSSLASDGTIRFLLPSLGGITTTTANTNGILGGFATVTDAGGVTGFAANDGTGNIVRNAGIAQDDVSLWGLNQHITDSTGFTGSRLIGHVGSLRFNANGNSTVTIQSGGVLSISSGGILMTANAATGSHSILGGSLVSGINEVIVIQDSTTQALTISSSIGGTQGLTKSGVGALILTGVNHYSGVTELQGGTLRAEGGSALGDGTTVNLSDDQATTLEIVGDETVGAIAGANPNSGSILGVVDITAGSSLTIRGGNTVNWTLAGSGTLIKNSTLNATNFNIVSSTTSAFTGSVIVNGGLFQLSGASARLNGATSFTINKGGSFLIDNNDDSSTNDRLSDSAAFTLHSADGSATGTPIARGLWIRSDNNGTENETIGVLTFGSGGNYLTSEGSGGTSNQAFLIASNFVRSNGATVNVRGRNLGSATNERSGFRITTGTAENDFIANNLVGGGGTAATAKNVSIVPWAIGELTTTANIAEGNMGNSFVTYVAGSGFRALDLTNQYSTFATLAGATDHNVREVLEADLSGLTGTTVNSLILHNSTATSATYNVTGTGTLTLTSGALLFTLNPSATASTASGINLGGFSGIAAGATNEYVIHVVNPSSLATTPTLTATISSDLTSAADITKSGRGTLVLSGTNTAGGNTRKTTINEGILEIAELGNIGGNSGGLVFAGGTLRLATGFTDDISQRSISILNGGATLDTNGGNFVLANSIGGGGLGGFTKIGLGDLTFMSTAAYAGPTTIVDGRVILNGGGNNRISSTGALVLGGGTTSGILQLGNVNGATTQTITELSISGTGTANAIVGGGATASTLIIDQDTVTTFAGAIGGAGTNENNLNIVKSGVGILTLSGTTISFNGTTTVSGGTLNITGSTATALATSGLTVAGSATLNLLNGVGQAINVGPGSLNLGSGTGATVLGLELGSTSAYDSISTSGTATTTGEVVLNITGLSGFGLGNYDLLTAGSGLSIANYKIGTVGGTLASGVTLGLTVTDTFVRLGAVASTGDFYWRGGINNSWMGFNGMLTNFTTDLAGTINANGTPGAVSTVYFSAQNASGPTFTTTLDASFTINDLRFLASPTGVTSVSIAPGTPATNSLTIAPSSSADGINVADNAGAITISAPIVLGANQTWTVAGTGANGSSLTVSGSVTGSGTLTIASHGSGIVTLSSTANTYNGATTVSSGILRSGATNSFSANSAYTISSGGILRLNGFSNAIGSLAGAGIVENGGTANITLTAGANNTSTTFSGILRNGSTGTLALTKVGNGKLTLSGTNTFTGSATINGGKLEITGDTNNGAGQINLGTGAGTRGMLLVGPGAIVTTTDSDMGTNATGAGAGYQTDGTVTITGADATNRFTLGASAGGYGYYKLSGGTLNSARLTAAGNNFAGATGVYEQTGGTANFTTWAIVGHGSGNALVDVSGGNFNVGTDFALNHVSDAYSVVNVRGTGVITKGGTTAISLMRGNANSLNNVGIFNVLSGGVLATSSGGITAGGGTGSLNNVALLNFNGGTLKTNAASSNLINISGATLTANSGAYIYSGGMTVDTNGFDSTISGPLRAPEGSGVQSVAVSNGGSGYIGAPVIKISGGSGVGATAIANMVDDGTGNGTYMIGSITITNPGTGYLPTDVLTLTFGDNTSVYTTQATLGAVTFNAGNVSGGLTKIGAGKLTLSGVNTYTGGTSVQNGTLALGAANVLADSGAVTVNGGIFDVATFSETVGTVTLQNGFITGTTGVLTGTSYLVESGSISAILAGTASLTKSTAGTVTLSGTNTFSGAVNLNGGTLAFSTAANLGNGSATNSFNFNGGALRYTGTGAAALAAVQSVNVASGGATFDVSSATGTLTVAGNVTGSTGGDLTKTGSGTLVLTGTNNLGAGGATNVVAGTLRGGFGTGGTSAITVSGAGTLELYDGVAQSLTLGGTAGALTLSDGATIGFELGAPGTNDALIIAAGGTAITSGTIFLNLLDLGGIAPGTYDLISILGGGGGLSSANFVVGNAPTGLNYSINKTDNLVQLIASTLVLRYWTGDTFSASWATNNVGDTNWASNASGTTDAGATPGAADTVIFSATNAVGPTIGTTLDGNRTIDSLQFLAVPAGVTGVTIAPGSGGTLTLAPATPSNGIFVDANGGNILISALLRALNTQTWNIDGTGASSLTVSGNTIFTGRVTKTGAGVLTLSGTNSGTGGITLAGGTLNINSGTALGTGLFTIGAGTTINNTSGSSVFLTTNNAKVLEGDFTFTGSNGLDMGGGAVTLGASLVLTANASTLTIGGSIGDGADNFLLTKSGAGALTLAGANTWSGGMTLNGGTLNINHASALGTGTFTINGGTTINNDSFSTVTSTTNNAMIWNGDFTFTGSFDLNLGTGAVNFGSAAGTSRTVTVSAGTLTVGGAITDGAVANSLVKLGGGTLRLTGLSTTAANNYTGGTTLGGGTTILTSSANFTGGLTIGSSAGNTAVSTLDLSTASATFGGPMLVQTNNATANTITLGSGQTLQVNGSVMVGYNPTASGGSNTRLTITGANSAFRVGGVGAPTNANFSLGGGLTDNFSNTAVLDMSGLGTFYANLGSGTFRVGDATNGSGTSQGGSTLILAADSTIIAATITSDSPSSTVTQVIKLGSGSNVFNANTINIGASSNRSNGTMDFNGATGTLVVRNLAGNGRANMNIASGGSGTAATYTSTVTLTGHNADLFLGTLAVGGRSSGNTGSGTGNFSFNTGILDATTVNVGSRTGTSLTTGSVTGNVTLGGGTSIIGTMTLGTNSVTTAVNNATGDANATLAISGGTHTITTMTMGTLAVGNATALTSGSSDLTSTANLSGGTITIGSLTMGVNNTTAATATANTATSTINISGTAAVSVTGNLTMGATTLRASNTATASINITGGSLTVGGNIQYTDGLGTENNTVTLNGGSLDMTDGNIGSGTALVTFNAQSGTLANVNEINGGAGLTKTTAGTLILEGINDYTGITTISAGVLQVGSGAGTGTLGVGNVTNNATLRFNRNNSYTASQNITGTGAVQQVGTGITVLSGANAYAGGTTVSAGTVVANHTSALGTGDVSVTSSGTLSVGDGARLSVNIGGSLNSSGKLEFDIFGRQAGSNPQLNNDILVLTSTDPLDTITLTGTLKVNDTTGTSASTWALNDMWQLIDWAGFAGTLPPASTNFAGFTSLDLPTLGAGMSWNVITNTTGLYLAVVVPEPSRLLLLGLGFMLIFFRRRRR